MVDPFDTMQTLAEIAVGLVGFSGMVAVFIRRTGGEGEIAAFRVANLLSLGFTALFLALVPIGLAMSGLDGPELWQAASGTQAAAIGVLMWTFLRRGRLLSKRARAIFSDVAYFRLTVWPTLGAFAASVANAFAWPFGAFASVYFWALIWMLALTAITFARTVFGPQRSVERQLAD